MIITLNAPAKVNLCLKVTGKRPDGYHNIVTLMQPLSISDRLTIDLGPEDFRLTCSDIALNGSDNLVLKAARAWFEAAGKEPRGWFHLEKNLPVAAGLGGGSSDAAACLMGLNALHGGVLPPQRLQRLAAGLGADVPFFLSGVTAFCTGIGENVHPWPEFPHLDYVLINPAFALSTSWVYKHFDFTWTFSSDSNKIVGSGSSRLPWSRVLVNDLEAVSLRAHPELIEIKETLNAAGAMGTLMSGSGPTVFGVFPNQKAAQAAAELLLREVPEPGGGGRGSPGARGGDAPPRRGNLKEKGDQTEEALGRTNGPKHSSVRRSWWVRACRGITT